MHTHAHTHLQEIVPATSQQATQFISETSKSTHCTEQVYTLPSSREYDRMRQNFDTIITQLAAAKCSISLANKLRSEGLVSPEVYEEGVNVGPIVESKRIGCMINNVLARVKLNPEHYSTFIEILIEIGGQEDLVQLLQGMGNRSNILLCALFESNIYTGIVTIVKDFCMVLLVKFIPKWTTLWALAYLYWLSNNKIRPSSPIAESNGPFRKLSRAMLVTSFGGQCRKKTAIFYECEGFSRRLRVRKRAL